jgi:hypothetical protein
MRARGDPKRFVVAAVIGVAIASWYYLSHPAKKPPAPPVAPPPVAATSPSAPEPMLVGPPAPDTTPPPAPAPSPEPVADRPAPPEDLQKMTDFGDVELQDGVAVELRLNSGQKGILTPTVLPDGSIELAMQFSETSSDGTTTEITAPRITCLPGHEVSISVGDIGVKLTPRIKGS